MNDMIADAAEMSEGVLLPKQDYIIKKQEEAINKVRQKRTKLWKKRKKFEKNINWLQNKLIRTAGKQNNQRLGESTM